MKTQEQSMKILNKNINCKMRYVCPIYWLGGADNLKRLTGPVLILILAILMVGFFQAVPEARPMARQSVCLGKMSQILIALHAYHSDFSSFPPAYTVDSAGNRLHSWRVLILPYIEEKTLFEKIRQHEPWDSEYNKQFHLQVPDVFICPERNRWKNDPILPWIRYQLVVDEDTLFEGSKTYSIQASERDHQKYLMLVEATTRVHWMSPIDFPVGSLYNGIVGAGSSIQALSGHHFSRDRIDGTNVGFSDSSVMFLPINTPIKELVEMSRFHKTPINNLQIMESQSLPVRRD